MSEIICIGYLWITFDSKRRVNNTPLRAGANALARFNSPVPLRWAGTGPPEREAFAFQGCANANRGLGQPRTVEIIKSEEKGSDVKLAVHLLNDAWLGAYDVALVISNDRDLAEAGKLARATGRPIGVVNPQNAGHMNKELYDAASFRRRIEHKHLKAAQMPASVQDGTSVIVKPTHW